MNRYYANRAEAGSILADLLQSYRYEDAIVIALNDGGIAVGEPIAATLGCPLTMLLSESVDIPGEPEPFGSVNQDGVLTYNGYYSVGEREGYYSEFHGLFDSEKREKFQKINHLLADGDILNAEMVKERIVVFVADGLLNGVCLDAALDFLKPVHVKKIVVAVPMATVAAVDKMHVLADELHVLTVNDDLLEITHYYDDNDLPTHEQVIEKLTKIL